MSIPKSFIDQVLDQTDIVDVVGRRVQLNKKGSNYWGVCPFHDDHTRFGCESCLSDLLLFRVSGIMKFH